jgi:hypothetical protein
MALQCTGSAGRNEATAPSRAARELCVRCHKPLASAPRLCFATLRVNAGHTACTTRGMMDVTTHAHGVGELIFRIADDVKTIARNEIELVAQELAHTAKRSANDAAIVVLGGIVALIGFGLLCLSAVVALAPVISSLALRLLVMALVYLAAGGAVAGALAVRLKRNAVPDLSLALTEARLTLEDVKHGLTR